METQPVIPLAKCQHGYLYELTARNFRWGVFNQRSGGFIGIRLKFENRYLATEYHTDQDAPHGTAHPHVQLEKCPLDDLSEGSPGPPKEGSKFGTFRINRPLQDWLEQKKAEIESKSATPSEKDLV